MHHRNTSSVSSFSGMSVNGTTPLRARKMSTGGNRSWSEEEESYLLQTRQQKMPYKHIAQHLNKTELACRLHYHQLSHGSHRRKRNASVSSVASSVISTTSTNNTSPCSQFSLPNDLTEESSCTQPITPPNNSPKMQASSLETSPMGSVMHPPQQKVILPRLHPRLMTPQASPEPRAGLRIDTNMGTLNSGAEANTATTTTAVLATATTANSSCPSVVLPFHHHGYPSTNTAAAANNNNTTSPNTQHAPHVSGAFTAINAKPEPASIDTARLRQIYESHRAAFWAAVAADYGPNVSAAQLEDIWRQGVNIGVSGVALGVGGVPVAQGQRPPTPDRSPDGSKAVPGFWSRGQMLQLPLPVFEPGQQVQGQAQGVGLGLGLSVGRVEEQERERRGSKTTIASLLTEDRNPRP